MNGCLGFEASLYLKGIQNFKLNKKKRKPCIIMAWHKLLLLWCDGIISIAIVPLSPYWLLTKGKCSVLKHEDRWP